MECINGKNYLTLSETADRWGMSYPTIANYTTKGIFKDTAFGHKRTSKGKPMLLIAEDEPCPKYYKGRKKKPAECEENISAADCRECRVYDTVSKIIKDNTRACHNVRAYTDKQGNIRYCCKDAQKPVTPRPSWSLAKVTQLDGAICKNGAALTSNEIPIRTNSIQMLKLVEELMTCLQQEMQNQRGKLDKLQAEQSDAEATYNSLSTAYKYCNTMLKCLKTEGVNA